MTTVSIEARPARLRRTQIGPLSLAAWLYWAAIVVPAAVGIPLALTYAHGGEWSRFVLLTGFASVSQLLSFHLNRRRVFHPGILFVVAGALLLPPQLLVLLIVFHCFLDWVKQRYPWYIQSFNIANYLVAGMAAWGTARGIGFTLPAGREAAAGTFAVAVLVVATASCSCRCRTSTAA